MALQNTAQTVEGLECLAGVWEWFRSVPEGKRNRLWLAIGNSSDEVQRRVLARLDVLKNPGATPVQREQALKEIAEVLLQRPNEIGEVGADSADTDASAAQEPPSSEVRTRDTHQAEFARRLRGLLEAKRISQQELATRVGCSQPAISQLLSRRRRPQKETIVKLAGALDVEPRDLWPDIEVVEMLDAVASFQEDEYATTEAEARALSDPSKRNRPKIRPKSLPASLREPR